MEKLRGAVLGLVVLLASLAVARAQAIANPLADAKEGEWVAQRTSSRYGDRTIVSHTYLWISKVDGKKLTVMMQVVKDDLKTAELAANPVRFDLDAPPEPAKTEGTPVVSEDTLEVKGKKVKCTKTESVTLSPMGRHTTISWTSNELPVFGDVKRMTKDKDGQEILVVETVDWGTSGGAERPVG